MKLIKNLDSPVKFLVFDKTDGFDRFRSALEEYKYQSPSKVAVEYIDADKKPVEARQYQVQSYGTVVIEYKGRTERVTSAEEQELTGGLVKVLNPNKKKVYFLQGHGEKDTEEPTASATARSRPRSPATTTTSRRSCSRKRRMSLPMRSVVVIAGPTTDLLQPEVDMLQRFLRKGGHVLVLIDPPDEKTPPMPVLEAFRKTGTSRPARTSWSTRAEWAS